MNYINTMNRGWYIRLASAAAVFLLFLMASTNVSAQSAVACTTATNVANFGADADLFANTPNADGDDWFSSPTFPGIGQGIIGLSAATAPRQISAAQFNTLITTTASVRNTSYEQRMAAPYQTVVVTPTGANILLDAVAARDHWTDATPDSSAFVGSNKNGSSPLIWRPGIANVANKSDLIDVGGHVRRFTTSPTSAGELWGYAYATRNSTNGNSYVDFEVYRTAPVFNALTGQVTNSGPASTGGHTAGQFNANGTLAAPGDLLVMVPYTNGGTVPITSVRVWVNPKTMIAGTTFPTYQDGINYYNSLPLSVKLFDFTGLGINDVDASANGYGYFEITPKSGSGCLVYANTNTTSTRGTAWGSVQNGSLQTNIAALQLVEVAINFSAFGLDIVPASGPCFNLLGSLVVKTRSSASYSAELLDYAGPYVFGAFAEVNAEAGASKEITCTNPTVTLSGASTTPNATYTWSTSNGNIVSGSNTLSPVVNQPGTYYLRVTNPIFGSCDALDSVVVTLNNQPAAVACTPGPAITCANGSSNLTAVATPSGSNTITGYSWSNGGSAASTSVADGNTYAVTVTQSNGCTATSSCNVVVNTCAPTANATNAGDITCTNTAITVSANASACSGETLSYLWSTGASTPTIDVTTGGTYSVTITQAGNGCTTSSSTTVGVNNANPTVSCNPIDNITCSNPTSDICVTASASGSNTISGYSWTKFGSGNGCISVNNGDPYTVTVTQSNGCTATATCNAVVDTCRPQINATNNGPITCTNTSRTVSSTATPCLGETVSYLWSNGETGSSFSTTTGGAYTVTVSHNGNGCSASASTTLGVDNSSPSVFCAPAQPITCAASTTELSATATPSSGNSAVSYLWSPGGATTPSITVNNGDTYTVTFTQSNGCTATSSCSAVVDTCRPSVSASNGGPITCTTPTPSISAIGTACGSATLAYLWNNGQTADNFTTAAAGTYSVTVTQSSNGCTASASTILESNNTNPTVTCSANTNITCSTTSVDLNSSASASGTNTITGYSWTNGETTSSIAVSDGNTYTVTVTQSNGCTASSTCAAVVDTCRPSVTANNGGPITCTNPSIAVTANATACNGESLSYSWNNSNTGVSFNTSTAGVYTVTVTHIGNGCTASASTTVGTNNTTPTVSCAPVQAITCSNTSTQLTATATPTTGNSAVGFLWSPGGATTSSITVNNGDTYTVTFTQSNGCTATSSCSAVVDTCRPSVSATNNGPITCNNSTPTVSATGTPCAGETLAYSWNNGQTGSQFNTAASGSYTVTVTQSTNGCTASASTILESNNTTPTISCEASENITCSTTSVNLNSSASASGTNTITGYSWSNGETTSSIAVSDGNSYTVTVTQSNGCTATSSCEAFVDTCSPSVIATNAGPITCTSPSVSVTANGSACLGESLSYSWNNSNTGVSFNTSTAGVYTVTVTHNGNGCTASASTTVGTNNSTPTVSCTPGADITCTNTSTTLTAVAVAAGANSITNYAWSPGAGNTPTITVNNGATYTITVTQSNGCTASNTCAAVVDNCNPTVTVANPADITCLNTSSTMSAVANSCNGDALTYSWNTGSSAASISESTAGTYTVTVTQTGNGCTATASTALVVDNCVPTATATNSGNINCTNPTSTIAVSATPCPGKTLVYSWNNSLTATSFTASAAGTYSVTVTQSGNGCTTTAQTTITADLSRPTVSCAASGEITCATTLVDLDATASASTGNSITGYSWTPGGATSASIPVNDGTSYTVTVTQSNGCTATSNCAATVNTTTPSCSIAGPVSVTCNSGGNNVSATVTDADAGATYSWSIVSGTGYTITSGNTATLTFTAGSGNAVFELTVTNSNGCSSTCNVTVNAVCGERYCTYTQGAYGNAGGTHCNGLTTPAFVAQLIGANPIVIGGNGNQISFSSTDVNCLISRLPGGGLSAPLTGTSNCQSPSGIAIRNGKFANTLLTQTITLSLNLRINGGALATLPITGIYLTTQASTGAGCGTTGTGIPGTDMVYSIPQSVVNYLTASGNNTVGDLLFLANSALARTYVPSNGTPSLSAIAAAVDAINNAFDECRIFAGFSNMLASTVRSTVPFDETGAGAQLEANGIVAKAFPNPFQYTTTIEFTMSNYCANVTVDVFSLNGEKVATLYQGEVNGGQVKRLDFNAEKLADGIYVYRIATNDNVYYDKLILNK